MKNIVATIGLNNSEQDESVEQRVNAQIKRLRTYSKKLFDKRMLHALLYCHAPKLVKKRKPPWANAKRREAEVVRKATYAKRTRIHDYHHITAILLEYYCNTI